MMADDKESTGSYSVNTEQLKHCDLSAQIKDLVELNTIEPWNNDQCVKKLKALVTSNTDAELKMLVECIKSFGNEQFTSGNYSRAADIYTLAIKLDSDNAFLYTNRSAANIRLENYGYALEDADHAIAIDPKCVKAYYRKATAFMALGRYKEALGSFELVSRAIPNDKSIQKKLDDCRRQLHRLAFERAICLGSSSSETEFSIDPTAIDIPVDYDGPTLPETGIITQEFVQNLQEHFKNQKKLHRRFAYQILLQARDHFKQSKTLINVNIPQNTKITVCGDVHGQYFDLLNIFNMNGCPSSDNPYIFNGDFVDRGSFSTECIFLLLAYKLLYPDQFFMTRGNHEAITMNEMYGFMGEVKAKYDQKMFKLFTEIFNYLPLCYVLNNSVAVMHGGLFSDENVTLEDIAKIDRNRQPPESGLMCDILWSDPCVMSGRQPSKRGVGLQFGPDVTESFCNLNKLKYIIRSHEMQPEGIEIMHNGKCITVFSAPNYCDSAGNKGAFLKIDHELDYEITKFEAVPHPDVRPMAYSNSMPFLQFL